MVPEPTVKVTTLVGSGVPVVGVSVVSVPDSVVGCAVHRGGGSGVGHGTCIRCHGECARRAVRTLRCRGGGIPRERCRQRVAARRLARRDVARRGARGIGVRRARLGSVQGERDGLACDGRVGRGVRQDRRHRSGRREIARHRLDRESRGCRRDDRGRGSNLDLVVDREPEERPRMRVDLSATRHREAMSTFQMSPEVESPVQKELPSGSRLMAKSEPWQPGQGVHRCRSAGRCRWGQAGCPCSSQRRARSRR